MRATVLRLQNQAGAERVDPAGTEILARVIGDGLSLPWKSSCARSVVVDGAITEPNRIFRANRLIDARGELLLMLTIRGGINRIVVAYACVHQVRAKRCKQTY